MSTRNKNLHQAKRNKNDEFYTRYEDIEKELKHYKEYLKGKTVYCPCDDYRWSNFVKYFKDNFSTLGLKKLYASNYDIGEGAYKYSYDGKVETVMKCEGNGDFRSEECKKLLNASDMVATNPPFSKFNEFLEWIGEKDFLIIGSKNAMLFQHVFPRYLEGKLFYGYSQVSRFILPGNAAFLQGSGRWFTTFKVNKETHPLKLADYDPARHRKYDNYNAVNCNSIKDIPDLNDIEIGVPIGIFDYLNEGQFKITGMLRNGSGGCDRAKPEIEGKCLYMRVLVRKR